MLLHKRTLTLLSLLALALPQAAAASSDAVIKDCSDNSKLDKKHSRADLKKAKKNLPSDINEYTDCGSIINRALAASSGGGNGGGPSATAASNPGGGSGPAPAPTGSGPAAKSPAKPAPKPTGAKPTVAVGGQAITPQQNGLFKASSSANELPLPILLALIGIAALTAVGGALVLNRRGGLSAALRAIRR